LATYRAGMMQSREWWRQACERERALRACTALGTDRGTEELAEEFSNQVLPTFGDGRCMVLLNEGNDVGWRIVAATGVAPDALTQLRSIPLPPALSDLVGLLSRRGDSLIQRDLDSIQRHSLSRKMPAGFFGKFLVALPIIVEGVVGGVVLLTADQRRLLAPSSLALWRAMAGQVGLAIGKSRLLVRLQQALDVKNEFVNTMSHELRSPLNVIIGYSEMLQDSGADPGFMAGRIRANALELLLLIENTMSAARLGAGKVRLQTEEVEVAGVFREIADSLRTSPEAAASVPIDWQVEPTLPRVRLDRLKLKEIVQNLVSNGLKYAPGTPIEVTAFQDGGRLRIEVRDRGPGIAPEAQARIFEMFERIEQAGTISPAGVGLGLYIVKGLVTLMGGSLDLDSQPGVGSRFIVRLPLAISAESSPRHTEAAATQIAVGY
ncbi:MAG TPA: HAMP domain-containing sensor histidine kinase, partial [Candidatus Acidoferrales bacterium]|nr:HAMP domain-containing sensor histidine kinase [Candidatus Acidoferrales bacterium]